MHVSLLEEMISVAEQTEHPSPFEIEKLPFYGGSNFSLGRAAVEELTDPEQINSFMEQYVQLLA